LKPTRGKPRQGSQTHVEDLIEELVLGVNQHAGARHAERFRKSANTTNAAMSPRQMKLHCQINAEATGHLEHAMEEMNFSARAHDRILKVSRTLTDLSASPDIRASDILDAIQYRSLDRKLFS
jgi:magnesium chelatase family protein